jgi:hypothetical protein
VLGREPLLLVVLDEARRLQRSAPRLEPKRKPAERTGIAGLSSRAQRHLRIAALGLRRAGLLGFAGVPGMKRQVRTPLKGIEKAAAGMYLPAEIARSLASAGARRGIPWGRYKYGRRGLGAAAAIRYRYGRGGIY